MSDQAIRLAIVDDDAEMIKLMTQRIQDLDTIELVGTANDVEKGLALIHANKVDAVLIDLVMPGHDGFYMLEELNRLRPNRPVCIMVSALNAPHVISRAAELGADHFVLKPFDMDLLFRRIAEISRYKNHGAFEGFKAVQQYVLGLDVEVVGWFVQDEEVHGFKEHPEQGEAAFFAAG